MCKYNDFTMVISFSVLIIQLIASCKEQDTTDTRFMVSCSF